MGLLTGLLSLPVTGPARGLQFILEQIQERVDVEMLDEKRVEVELFDLNLRLDLGEIAVSEFIAREAELLDELNAIRAHKESLAQPNDETAYNVEEGAT